MPKERADLLLIGVGKLWTANVTKTVSNAFLLFHFHCSFRYSLIKFWEVENSYLKFKLLNSLLLLDGRMYSTRIFRE